MRGVPPSLDFSGENRTIAQDSGYLMRLEDKAVILTELWLRDPRTDAHCAVIVKHHAGRVATRTPSKQKRGITVIL